MPITEKRKETMIEYAKKNLKRIPLDVQKQTYEAIKAHAEGRGETVNGFIKRAIDETMAHDNNVGPLDPNLRIATDLANELGVKVDDVVYAERFSNAIDVIREQYPALADAILRGKVSEEKLTATPDDATT